MSEQAPCTDPSAAPSAKHYAEPHSEPHADLRTDSASRRRCAVVGLGARARLFTQALAGPYADRIDLVGFCDVNAHRMAVHNGWLAAGRPGREPVPAYAAEDFDLMLRRERVDLVVVCSVDRTHDDYIVRALEAGCDVVTEKPMTTDADRARRILAARQCSGREVRVAFNYRYNPVHSAVRELLAAGEIGEVGSVHFEWLLDLRHGADYFRRWHRDKANSGGLMVHKATHHFDLVNWWLGTEPETVFAQGGLFFYGDAAGTRRGLARPYARAHGSPAAQGDPFAVHLMRLVRARRAVPGRRGRGRLPPRPERVRARRDHRGRHGGPRAVRVRGVPDLPPHRVRPLGGLPRRVQRQRGLTELLVEESTWLRPEVRTDGASPVMHGADVGDEAGRTEVLLRRHWERPREVKVPTGEGGHGGGDVRMLQDLFGPHRSTPDPLGRAANATDGARSLVTGLAANESFATGRVVRVRDLLDV